MTLQKTKTVLSLQVVSPDGIPFANQDEDGQVGPVVVLTPEVWEDMGKSDVVTVTVEPGDRLNG